MTKMYRILLLLVCMVPMVTAMGASPSPPDLPKDPAVKTGTLSDGITYYIVKNTSEKGMAEFALVQKGDFSDKVSSAAHARETASMIPMIDSCSARSFVLRNGTRSALDRSPLRDMVQVRDDAITWRFGSFVVSEKETVMDSTLLMMFGIIDSRDKARTPSPSSFALIVSGDVDSDKVLSKMKMLSMLVPPAKDTSPAVEDYKWQVKDTMTCIVSDVAPDGIAELSVTYSSPRTPREYMGSAITTVSDHMVDILTKVIKRRINVEMKRQDIPFAGVECRYYKSSDGPGDETYTITVRTAPEHAKATLGVVASILSDLDNKGCLPKEYADARNEYMIQLYRESLNPLTTNGSYVDACESAFLYNAGISTKSAKYTFLARGELADTTRTRLFNNFAKELIDSTLNLTVTLNSDALLTDDATLRSAFLQAWEDAMKKETYTSYYSNMSDTLALGAAKPEKLKVSQTRTEPLSGGTMWIFSNGMKVVYKRMETSGLFYYNMMIKGGYSSISDIRQGEGAFLSDVLETYDIAGLPSTSFNHLMLSCGITMTSKVGVSDLNISGMAPRPALTLLMKCLSSVANDRTINQDAFDYYRAGETLRLQSRAGTLPDRVTAMDSLICPSYKYSSYKSIAALHGDLPQRTMDFFDRQFSRVNDGVLVIVGDMDETAMRKFLQKNLGRFRTQPSVNTRVRLPYQPISGWMTHTSEGKSPSFDVIMSAQLPYTAENYMAMKVMAVALEGELNEAMEGMGTRVIVKAGIVGYPQERVNLLVATDGLGPGSLPVGEAPKDPLVLMFRLRSAMSDLAANPISASKVTSYKNIIKNNIASMQSDPRYWTDVVKVRFSDGKDINTKYSEKVDAVTPEKIREIAALLNSGSKVEYVVR